MKVEMLFSDDRLVWDLWLSQHWLPSIVVADELGLFPALAADPLSAAELAEKTGFARRGLDAVLAMLTSLELVWQRQGQFGLADVTRSYLLPDSPLYWGAALEAARAGASYNMIKEAVTRRPDPNRPSRPVDHWETGQMTAEQARSITRYMHGHHVAPAVTMAAKGDFGGVERLLDVGGGSGVFSIALAQRYPHMRCTVMDLPPVCAVVPDYTVPAGVADRVDTAPVDMFREPWPEGHDAMLFCNVFHDWDFETCRMLAAKSFAALPKGGRIYLQEMILDDDGAGPRAAVAFSVLMLRTQGRQYTAGQLTEFLEGAGFRDVRTVATHSVFSLVSAVKP